MSRFVRATTPSFTLTVKDEHTDLTQMLNVYVTFEQGTNTITKNGEDLEVEEKVVKCWLTQTESLSLQTGSLDVQVNWTYLDSQGNIKRGATDTVTITVTSQLLDELLDEIPSTPSEVTPSDST